jgi:hypothetical protein
LGTFLGTQWKRVGLVTESSGTILWELSLCVLKVRVFRDSFEPREGGSEGGG